MLMCTDRSSNPRRRSKSMFMAPKAVLQASLLLLAKANKCRYPSLRLIPLSLQIRKEIKQASYHPCPIEHITSSIACPTPASTRQLLWTFDTTTSPTICDYLVSARIVLERTIKILSFHGLPKSSRVEKDACRNCSTL